MMNRLHHSLACFVWNGFKSFQMEVTCSEQIGASTGIPASNKMPVCLH